MVTQKYSTPESKVKIRHRNTKVSPFDDLASDYDAWFEREGKLIFTIEVRAFQQVLPSLPKPWLEVGVGSGRFAQVSGFSFTWTASGTGMVIDGAGNVVTPGTRVVEVMQDDGTLIVAGGAVVPGPPVTIAIVDFLANGGDQYPFRGASFTTVGVTYQQALSNFIVNGLGGLISAADYPEGGEGRITNLP